MHNPVADSAYEQFRKHSALLTGEVRDALIKASRIQRWSNFRPLTAERRNEALGKSLRINTSRIRAEVDLLKAAAFERVPEARLPEPVQQQPLELLRRISPAEQDLLRQKRHGRVRSDDVRSAAAEPAEAAHPRR